LRASLPHRIAGGIGGRASPQAAFANAVLCFDGWSASAERLDR
jgi:hypothetical protein